MEAITYLLNEINEKLVNGEINPLDAYIDLKRVEKLLKDVMQGAQEEAIDEAQKHGKGEHQIHGATIQVKNAAGRWDFSHLQEWQQHKAQLKAYEEAAKALYKGRNMAIAVDADTGEVKDLPKYTHGKTTISVKL